MYIFIYIYICSNWTCARFPAAAAAVAKVEATDPH